MIRFREATQGDLKGLLALYTQLNDNTMPEIAERMELFLPEHAFPCAGYPAQR